jgi:hypothetical protein
MYARRGLPIACLKATAYPESATSALSVRAGPSVLRDRHPVDINLFRPGHNAARPSSDVFEPQFLVTCYCARVDRDHAVNAAEWIVYDALYAYCQKMVRKGKPNGEFVT